MILMNYCITCTGSPVIMWGRYPYYGSFDNTICNFVDKTLDKSSNKPVSKVDKWSAKADNGQHGDPALNTTEATLLVVGNKNGLKRKHDDMCDRCRENAQKVADEQSSN